MGKSRAAITLFSISSLILVGAGCSGQSDFERKLTCSKMNEINSETCYSKQLNTCLRFTRTGYTNEELNKEVTAGKTWGEVTGWKHLGFEVADALSGAKLFSSTEEFSEKTSRDSLMAKKKIEYKCID